MIQAGALVEQARRPAPYRNHRASGRSPAMLGLLLGHAASAPRVLYDLLTATPAAEEAPVPGDYFGICVAAGPACEHDEYVVARLRELELTQARVDLTPSSLNGPQERLLRTLLREGFSVCLRLVPDAGPDESESASLARWREFVATVLKRAEGVSLVEIGSVPNRRGWSGLPHGCFLPFWSAAWREAAARHIPTAGPNVTDFEPTYSAALLGALARALMKPDWHSFNLLVERAIEPERYDPRVLGRTLAEYGRFDLKKKARVLAALSRRFGIGATMSSHASWSLRRIGRLTDDVEEKQADYVARYCCLAAASGALGKVYWGPLIGRREGLIDDGSASYPERPRVAFYGGITGNIAQYRTRPAFSAFQTAVRLLSCSRARTLASSEKGLRVEQYENQQNVVHALWTRDGVRALLADCYDQNALAQASILSRDGRRLDAPPVWITEAPTYLVWAAKPAPQLAPTADALAGVRFCHAIRDDLRTVAAPGWRGVNSLGFSSPSQSRVGDGPPVHLGETRRLRDSRNRVWVGQSETGAGSFVVKAFPASDRARRSWNGAVDLLRRGVATAPPVAFFERNDQGAAQDSEFHSCYVCEEIQGVSAREAFAAFRAGTAPFERTSEEAVFAAISDFVARMHSRRVYFRDLSAGNLMLTFQNGRAECLVVDTARARFRERPLRWMERLNDLKRLVHPLDWGRRSRMLEMYRTASQARLPAALARLFFAVYDFKHWVKRGWRRVLARRAG